MQLLWLNNLQRLGRDAAATVCYPQQCVLCGGSVEARADGCVCAGCWRAARIFDGTESCCGKCGALWPVTLAPEMKAKARCHDCRQDSFSAARAVGVYGGALRAAVLALKREPYLPARLSLALAQVASRAPLAGVTRLIPVPLHETRRAARGFNQAAIIGQALARQTGLSLDEVSLKRVSHTEYHRAGLDAKARRASVAQAFAVMRPRLLEKEIILLLDDVFTTGATVGACAAALRAAGAAEVRVLTLARVAAGG